MKKKFTHNIKVLGTLLLLGLLPLNAKVVFPNIEYKSKNIEWTLTQKSQNIALKHLKRTKEISTHIIRLKGQEKPHYHDRHSLQVLILSGKSQIHFKDHTVLLEKGDMVIIPKGTFHWAENLSKEASIVLATYSPAFDGKDKRLAKD